VSVLTSQRSSALVMDVTFAAKPEPLSRDELS